MRTIKLRVTSEQFDALSQLQNNPMRVFDELRWNTVMAGTIAGLVLDGRAEPGFYLNLWERGLQRLELVVDNATQHGDGR